MVRLIEYEEDVVIDDLVVSIAVTCAVDAMDGLAARRVALVVVFMRVAWVAGSTVVTCLVGSLGVAFSGRVCGCAIYGWLPGYCVLSRF